ncbi:MFS transporter [Stomatohabitans albus]|uniref:MFS transporter n=1 Tax=Stomatohabitans albus TaxID=3110766 RepID=UPI00300C17E5
MSSSPLKQLIREPVFRQWAVANVLVRMPVTMNLLSFILAGEYLTGSVGTGALLAGASTLCGGFSARFRGAQLDRSVLKYGLMRQVGESAVACLVLAVLVWMRAPLPLVFITACVMGVLTAAITGGLRSLLIPSVPPELLEAANSVDAVLVEVAFVSGPVVAGVIGSFFAAPYLIATEAVLLFIGVLSIRPLPKHRPNNEDNIKGQIPLFVTGAGSIYLLFFFFGFTFGVFDAALPEYVQTFGWKTATSGLLTTLISFGSGVGGILMTNVRGVLRKGRWIVIILYCAFMVAFGVPIYAPNPWIFGGLLFFVGLPIAPLMSTLMLALQHIVPKRQQSEGFALASATILVASGGGLFVSGLLMNNVEVINASVLLHLLPAIPFTAALFYALGMVRRHRAGKPQSLGYPLDPDISDPRD